MKFRKTIVSVGCIVFLLLAGAANFLAEIPEREASWNGYLAGREDEKILTEAESFRQRWDYRLLSLFSSSFIAGELAGLDRIEGQAAYNQRSLGQALAIYQRTKDVADPRILSFFHYNQAVIFTQLKKYDLAIGAYEHALRFNPGNKEAAYNLELLRKILRDNADDKESDKVKSGLDRFDVEDYEKWSKDKKNQGNEEEEKRW